MFDSFLCVLGYRNLLHFFRKVKNWLKENFLKRKAAMPKEMVGQAIFFGVFKVSTAVLIFCFIKTSIYHVPVEMLKQDVHGILKEKLKFTYEIPKPR